MMKLSTSRPDSASSLRPVGWLAAFTIAGWMAGALWPRLHGLLGIYDYGTFYLDSYALLAALDALRAGADPHAVNLLDPLMRPHVYSDWWLALRWLGLGRESNFLVGTAWAGGFALVAWTTVKPRSWGEAGWLAALMVSPPTLLAVNRANNDLVVFVVLAGCSLAATAASWWRQLVAVTCVALATGLKYFPAPAALAFLWVRPVRRMPGMLLAALLAVLLAMMSVWAEIDRSRFTVGSGVHVMGASLLWRDLGWQDTVTALPSVGLILLGAIALVLGRFTTGLAIRGEPRDLLRAALGAIVVLTCFVAGVNYAYRWIFILWPALWLWRQSCMESLPSRQRMAARVACALIGLCLWLDGGLCVVVNLLPPHDADWVNHVQLVYRRWSQPLAWLLMMMLAGWLLEAALATIQEWWSARHED